MKGREGGEGHVTQTRSFHSVFFLIFRVSHKMWARNDLKFVFFSLFVMILTEHQLCSPFLQTSSHSHFLLAQTFLPLFPTTAVISCFSHVCGLPQASIHET